MVQWGGSKPFLFSEQLGKAYNHGKIAATLKQHPSKIWTMCWDLLMGQDNWKQVKRFSPLWVKCKFKSGGSWVLLAYVSLLALPNKRLQCQKSQCTIDTCWEYIIDLEIMGPEMLWCTSDNNQSTAVFTKIPSGKNAAIRHVCPSQPKWVISFTGRGLLTVLPPVEASEVAAKNTAFSMAAPCSWNSLLLELRKLLLWRLFGGALRPLFFERRLNDWLAGFFLMKRLLMLVILVF